MSQRHKPTPEQKKRALVSGLVLGGIALAIYAVVVFKFFIGK